ncbi:hypothetical protein Clacol_000618 [Clathrus columnatus]|uniref:Dynactin subunit 2 n=1 Tax=Clathrus columnatus TaxID=1419009 RepID=A0AAV4ZYV0_9AGAM|nr:hypothetical protein Clacol_000618 [Clathrus columnatus]
MSAAAKYAGLPDIVNGNDTAPDVYETPDTFTNINDDGNSSEEDNISQRPSGQVRVKDDIELPSKEELDDAPLLSTDTATKKFRAAEKKRYRRPRLMYAYPPSPTSNSPPSSPTSKSRPPPLSARLRMLQHELAVLETELSDPSNPALHEDNGELGDPGVLMKGLLDVRKRLEKVLKPREGRGRLIEKVTNSNPTSADVVYTPKTSEGPAIAEKRLGQIDLAAMDKRVSELETLVGSSGTTLDESSPLPTPLLPLITRLGTQLTVLTQPRHIDSISRRLKILLSDLERVSAASGNANTNTSAVTTTALSQGQNRRQSQPANQAHVETSGPIPPTVQESLQPILTRLSPLLPHIPHILARLRTLSSLHNDAAAFQETLKSMEEEERRIRTILNELESAVNAVETSLQENSNVISSNVGGLEKRVEGLNRRLEKLGK